MKSPHHMCIYISKSHIIINIKIIIFNWFTKCISTNKWDIQLEHSSIIHNRQQNPPMYIYTNPHNHNINQISPIHKFIKSHIQLCHNSSTIKFQMSQVCIHQTHLSSTITIQIQQQDNISICNAPTLDTYMHVVP
jgi:hypothetical protein